MNDIPPPPDQPPVAARCRARTALPFAARGPRAWRLAAGLAFALLLAPISAAWAQIDSREGIALQNQVYQLRQELQTLRADIARSGGGYSGGGNDAAAQLLSRVQAMEEQLRQLRGRIDETQNLVNRHHADVLKRIDDLSFQMNLPGRVAPPAAAPMAAVPKPEPARPADPAPIAAPRPEAPPKVALPPPPEVIPMPPPAPPRSFTFNQIPEPMREAPRAAPPPAQPPAPAPAPPQTTIRLDPAPRIETPRVEPPRVEPPRAEPPRAEPPKVEVPRAEPPRPEAPRADPVRPMPRPPEAAPKPPPASATAQAPEAAPLAPVPPGGKRTPEMALQEGNAALARRDYAAAERAAREVMSNRTSPRTYDGQFLLARSLAGQKQFAQAAIAFDDAYNRSHKGRHAQDALIGLASALTAINERRAACDTLGRLRAEFPQVRADLQETITRTNERAACGR